MLSRYQSCSKEQRCTTQKFSQRMNTCQLRRIVQISSPQGSAMASKAELIQLGSMAGTRCREVDKKPYDQSQSAVIGAVSGRYKAHRKLWDWDFTFYYHNATFEPIEKFLEQVLCNSCRGLCVYVCHQSSGYRTTQRNIDVPRGPPLLTNKTSHPTHVVCIQFAAGSCPGRPGWCRYLCRRWCGRQWRCD